MKSGDSPTANDLWAGLSDDAIALFHGGFSFGSKATVNINPPHANLHANKASLDELMVAGHITYEYDARRDRHTYKGTRSEEHTSELQSLMRISYAVFCLKQKQKHYRRQNVPDTQE